MPMHASTMVDRTVPQHLSAYSTSADSLQLYNLGQPTAPFALRHEMVIDSSVPPYLSHAVGQPAAPVALRHENVTHTLMPEELAMYSAVDQQPTHAFVVPSQTQNYQPKRPLACAREEWHAQALITPEDTVCAAASQHPTAAEQPPAAKRTKVADALAEAWSCFTHVQPYSIASKLMDDSSEAFLSSESACDDGLNLLAEACAEVNEQCSSDSTPALNTGNATGIHMYCDLDSELSDVTMESLAGVSGYGMCVIAIFASAARGFVDYRPPIGAALDIVSIVNHEAAVGTYYLSLVVSSCCFAGVLMCWKLPPSLNTFFLSMTVRTNAETLAAIGAKQMDWMVYSTYPNQIATAFRLVIWNGQSVMHASKCALVAPSIFVLIFWFNPFNLSDRGVYRFSRFVKMVIMPIVLTHKSLVDAPFNLWWPDIARNQGLGMLAHTSLIPHVQESLWTIGWVFALGAPCPIWLVGIIVVYNVLLSLKIQWLQRYGDEWSSTHLGGSMLARSSKIRGSMLAPRSKMLNEDDSRKGDFFVARRSQLLILFFVVGTFFSLRDLGGQESYASSLWNQFMQHLYIAKESQV